jgi:RNA polymerase sigma-70 factor (ECF subfamily)
VTHVANSRAEIYLGDMALKRSPVGSGDSDEHLIERVRRGGVSDFCLLVQRHNRSVYRVARAILKDESEAEDVVQQAHLSAYLHLNQFQGRSKFSTWLGRIARREAVARLRARRRAAEPATVEQIPVPTPERASPEETASRNELTTALESAIDALPHPYRAAVVLRYVEDLDTHEAAEWLGVSEGNLRVLLHRARLLLRECIVEQVRATADELFAFGGERCRRVQQWVLTSIPAEAFA